ncbi:DoxX family protein [Pedobacter sp. SYSU D00535]|uniref:DoxX family protein n=1 Tax=Pedobacter sp. SYSU D00535 TaxID=2810308 RepID=UPI001A95FC7D|nr:DoxX family protein [Pedobacter sp. SYSU D00535]
MKSTFRHAPLSLDAGLLILRVFAGGLMLTHGLPKLMKVMEGNTQFGDPLGLGTELSLYLAILAEVLCALLVILGLFTRIATIPLIITMFVAFFVVHASDPLTVKELALIYLSIFLTIFFTGPGNYSIDRKIR